MTVTVDVGAALPVIGILLVAGLVVTSIVMSVRQIKRFFASRKFDTRSLAAMRRRWSELEALLDTPGEMSRKIAIIEADKLLDSALKSLAMPGATLGERLKFAQYKHPDLREVWWAHKVRNQLAHEASYHLDDGIARRAIREYRKALTRLGAI